MCRHCLLARHHLCLSGHRSMRRALLLTDCTCTQEDEQGGNQASRHRGRQAGRQVGGRAGTQASKHEEWRQIGGGGEVEEAKKRTEGRPTCRLVNEMETRGRLSISHGVP